MTRKTENQIKECWNHIKNYMDDKEEVKELHDMCKYCENYQGKNHDYSDCADMNCFKFWLAYEYLEWANSWD